MNYTNIHGIPEELAAAIAVDHYTDPTDKPYDYSVTGLINPVQQSELIRRYRDTDKLPKMDVLDGFNAWVGSVIHNEIERIGKKGKDSVFEERFYKEIGGKTLSGKVDLITLACDDSNSTNSDSKKLRRLIGETAYSPGNSTTITKAQYFAIKEQCPSVELKAICRDWKTCRLYKVQKADYWAWEVQANQYAMLVAEAGIDITEIEITAICLDWKRNEAKFKKGYPETPIVPIQLRIWPKNEQEAYAKERISMLERARNMTDEELAISMPCSRYDQWSQYQGCALIKEGNSKATKVFDSREQAEDYVADNPQYKEYNLEDRYSKRTRCMDYCSAKPVCQQYKREVAEENGTTKPKLKI